MNKKNPIYQIARTGWLFFKKVTSYISYIPYYIFKPQLPQNSKDTPKIVVSFTTYPARVKCLPLVIGSIVRQTRQPDIVVLYLSKKQFSDLDNPIFDSIRKQGVKITLVDDDLRSHKKYFYAMQEYAESIVITIDDDIIYDKYMIEDLYKSYLKHPKAVSAKRVHKIKFDSEKKVLPYLKWGYDTKELIDIESLELVATGCGGILYPAGSLNKSWNDPEGIKSTCLRADDLWLKVMEVLNSIPVVLVKSRSYKLKHVWGTDLDGLANDNVLNDGNDVQLANICRYLDVDLHGLTHR
ncbi:hypothetical protein V7659_17200 [Neobacillus drentensis]|uniref:hypothetical protein n=1 Tax=Neobacillus drentensis TaxID=220684 RepID=UPI003000A883